MIYHLTPVRMAIIKKSVCYLLNRVRLCDSMDLARQDPLSMEFSRQEYWSGFPFPSPGDLPELGIGIEAGSLA